MTSLSSPNDRVSAARLTVLGLNAWAVCALVPALHVGVRSVLSALPLVLPLAALVPGVVGARAARPSAAWLLGAGFPAALGASLALCPDLRRLEAWSPATLCVGAISLLAFLAVASIATSRPHVTRTTVPRPLPDAVVPELALGRLWRQRVLFAVVGVGALGVAVVAPWGVGPRELEAAWAGAAPEGLLLTCVTAGALATSLFALFVGPALRLGRSPPTLATRRLRVMVLLTLVVLGAAVLLLLGRLER